MAKKEEYRLKNQQFLEAIAREEGVERLPSGVLYKVITRGESDKTPTAGSVVSVHFRGTLINGREFDNSWKRGCPEAFRLRDVIEGWQHALMAMHPGDRWMI